VLGADLAVVLGRPPWPPLLPRSGEPGGIVALAVGRSRAQYLGPRIGSATGHRTLENGDGKKAERLAVEGQFLGALLHEGSFLFIDDDAEIVVQGQQG
jgi:hypothetical protein